MVYRGGCVAESAAPPRDLPLERGAVRPMLRHGFLPPEAQQEGSIQIAQSVHPQGRTPKGGQGSKGFDMLSRCHWRLPSRHAHPLVFPDVRILKPAGDQAHRAPPGRWPTALPWRASPSKPLIRRVCGCWRRPRRDSPRDSGKVRRRLSCRKGEHDAARPPFAICTFATATDPAAANRGT
jgi:hypothetical protein